MPDPDIDGSRPEPGRARRPVALHVCPHPDDEILGAGATLTALADAGWRVVNLACGLGRPPDHSRRGAELADSLVLLGIEGATLDPPAALSASDDLEAAAGRVAAEVVRVTSDIGADLVISPHRGDGHHGHVAVARGVEAALERLPAVTWWTWGLWADLSQPNLYFPFDGTRLMRLIRAMEIYEAENARNPYIDLIPVRARATAILGSERVFGYGSPYASTLPYAEVLLERRLVGSEWVPGPPRLLDPDRALEA